MSLDKGKIVDALKAAIKVEVDVNALGSEVLGEALVLPLLRGLAKKTSWPFDDALVESQADEIKELLAELLDEGEDALERATGVDLDGKDDDGSEANEPA